MEATIQSIEMKSVALPGRVKLEYAEQGDPAGIPVVLLHGYTDSWHSFDLVLPHLPPFIHAFAPSQRGHGDSERPLAGYRPEDFAADAVAFMDECGLEQAVIVGTSMGSIIAERFALNYPARVLGLVLASAAISWRTPAVMALWDVLATLEDPVSPDFAREFQESTLARPVPPAFLKTVVAESLKVPARVWRAALCEGHIEVDIAGELGAIKAPTLILRGDRDAINPRREQEALAAAIPGSRVAVYHDAGHALHWDQPERFAADLTAFVESLDQ